MYEELVKRLREESEIERWLQPHSANETPKLLDDAAHAIEELSKERKTGKWVLPNNEVAVYLNEWICSACNYLIDGKHNFCPHCGVKMIGGDEDV